MKKTSVYLDDEHLLRLRRAAEAEGRSQSEILRDAIRLYTDRDNQPPRTFAMDGCLTPGGIARKLGYAAIAVVPEEVLLEGFGE